MTTKGFLFRFRNKRLTVLKLIGIAKKKKTPFELSRKQNCLFTSMWSFHMDTERITDIYNMDIPSTKKCVPHYSDHFLYTQYFCLVLWISFFNIGKTFLILSLNSSPFQTHSFGSCKNIPTLHYSYSQSSPGHTSNRPLGYNNQLCMNVSHRHDHRIFFFDFFFEAWFWNFAIYLNTVKYFFVQVLNT